MIIKDNLLALRGFRDYGAEPWEYQPTEPGTYVKADAPPPPEPSSYYVAPRENYVVMEPGDSSYVSPSSQPAQTESTFNWTGLIDAAMGVVKGFTQPKQPTYVVQQRKPLIPKWVMPAAIVGGAGLVAVAVLAKPKRSSLAGYRRRKSRRSRR